MKWKPVLLSLAVMVTLTACAEKASNDGEMKNNHVQTTVKES